MTILCFAVAFNVIVVILTSTTPLPHQQLQQQQQQLPQFAHNITASLNSSLHLSCHPSIHRVEFRSIGRYSPIAIYILNRSALYADQYNVSSSRESLTVTILSVRYKDAGLYSCLIGEEEKRMEVIVIDPVLMCGNDLSSDNRSTAVAVTHLPCSVRYVGNSHPDLQWTSGVSALSAPAPNDIQLNISDLSVRKSVSILTVYRNESLDEGYGEIYRCAVDYGKMDFEGLEDFGRIPQCQVNVTWFERDGIDVSLTLYTDKENILTRSSRSTVTKEPQVTALMQDSSGEPNADYLNTNINKTVLILISALVGLGVVFLICVTVGCVLYCKKNAGSSVGHKSRSGDEYQRTNAHAYDGLILFKDGAATSFRPPSACPSNEYDTPDDNDNDEEDEGGRKKRETYAEIPVDFNKGVALTPLESTDLASRPLLPRPRKCVVKGEQLPREEVKDLGDDYNDPELKNFLGVGSYLTMPPVQPSSQNFSPPESNHLITATQTESDTIFRDKGDIPDGSISIKYLSVVDDEYQDIDGDLNELNLSTSTRNDAELGSNFRVQESTEKISLIVGQEATRNDTGLPEITGSEIPTLNSVTCVILREKHNGGATADGTGKYLSLVEDD